MELHGENTFKIRSYSNAFMTLRKLQKPLADMSEEEIGQIKGVGKAISGKVRELVETGQMQTLNKYLEKTPAGVVEMLSVSGFGPKKVKTVWEDLGVESVGELLYAVNENRLIELKGFGQKTQDDLKQKLEYFQRTRNYFHYASLEQAAEQITAYLQEKLGEETPVSLTGAIRREAITLDGIDVLVGQTELSNTVFGESLIRETAKGQVIHARSAEDYPVRIHLCAPEEFPQTLFRTTATAEFMEAFGADLPDADTEAALFAKAGIPVIDPVLRESAWAVERAREGALPTLLTEEDIKGVVHSHSTYSDGMNTLREMAEYSRDQGYEYLVITDHSKSAFYANGLQPDRVRQQMDEIDALNQELAPFRIYKGIESDILNDGSLDYEEDTLGLFEVIIASVHSNLRMDEAKATERLLRAIAHPRTTMLGHPTGRLLLSREGYPIDHQRVIDACAEHRVAIELNANPYRLDLDWTWIPYALEKGVWISVNPDAHSTAGIHDIHYGVRAARKGGLSADTCLNTMGLAGFSDWLTGR